MFDVRDLSVSFDGNDVLENISFDIPAGDCVALLGQNGSGKTTLCECLLGVIPTLHPANVSGLISVGSLNLAGLEADSVRQGIGFTLEDPEAQIVSLTVAEEVYLTLAAHDRKLSEASVMAGLRHFGIASLAERNPSTLSEGEKRRVSLAALDAAQPSAMILDEPTAALDKSGRETFCKFIARARARHSTVLFSTHDTETAARAADRYLGISKGLLVASREITDGANNIIDERVFFNDSSEELIYPPGGLEPHQKGAVVLDLKDVDYAYRGSKKDLLCGINLQLKSGQGLLVTGSNGSGKTTLLHLIAGLIRPSCGQISIRGMAPWTIPTGIRTVVCGLVFQNPEHQILMSTVGKEVISGLPPGARGCDVINERLNWIRTLFRLPSDEREPHIMSHGQKRMLTLATSLAPCPGLLLVDEAELGLDPIQKLRVAKILDFFRNHFRVAIVLVTHDETILSLLSNWKRLNLS